jgi:long-chain acyl-CoA synthetase
MTMAQEVRQPAERSPGTNQPITGCERPLFSLLDTAADEHPNAVYTIFNDGRRTYAQVRQAADRIAAFLHRQSILPGDRVAVVLPNLPHYPEIFFGILKAGGVCVPCDPLHTASELTHQLRGAEAKALFCMDHSGLYRIAVQALEGTGVETVVVCNVTTHLPRRKTVLGTLLKKIPRARDHDPDHFHYDQILADASAEPPTPAINPSEDPAVIIHTAGTTGKPKGATLTHANILFDILAMHEQTRLRQEPDGSPEPLHGGGQHCFLGALPWHHSLGLTLGLLMACHLTAGLVCVPDARAGMPPFTGLLMSIKKYRCTVLAGVPTLFAALARHTFLDKFDLSSLQICACGGAPLHREVGERFEDKTGALIVEVYGLSEASSVVTANPASFEERRFGTVGFPLPDTEVRIVDLETGRREQPQGQPGQIAISGPQVMAGYWNTPESDARAFLTLEGKRFFLSGDVGHFDQDGYLVITDRTADIIRAAGVICCPGEIEGVIDEHPAVAASAVIGVPDEAGGEAVKALVELLPGRDADEEEIHELCRERLSASKRPSFVEFRGQLPVSTLGTILRKDLRQEEKDARRA